MTLKTRVYITGPITGARRRARLETLAWHRLARLTKNEENAR